MDGCLLCDGELEIDEEVVDEDGVSTHTFYTCEDCGAYYVEHSLIEILDEGRGIE
jgi:hypothetical protein